MSMTVSQLKEATKNCLCGNKHMEIPIEIIEVGKDVLQKIPSFLMQKEVKKVAIIADKNTFEAAGEKVVSLLEGKFAYTVCFIKENENGDVVADEVSLIQGMLETPNDIDILLAVGSGTIHDITRFVSYKMGKDFISIPTAPSVDGFNSMGAPLIIRGVKTTFQTQAPIAIFADLNVLCNAPRKMIAAGFGDMLGKYTSLLDWKFANLAVGEAYCPLAAKITRDALEVCIKHLNEIDTADEEGIAILIDALIQSGIAMLIIGQSYSASGGEHHVSHYWEMDFIQKNKPQVLHGAKVGVACLLIAELYKTKAISIIQSKEKLTELLPEHNSVSHILGHQEGIIKLLDSIPESSELKSMLQQLGGPTTTEELGIDEGVVERSLKEAHLIRKNRFTVLKFMNEVVKE